MFSITRVLICPLQVQYRITFPLNNTKCKHVCIKLTWICYFQFNFTTHLWIMSFSKERVCKSFKFLNNGSDGHLVQPVPVTVIEAKRSSRRFRNRWGWGGGGWRSAGSGHSPFGRGQDAAGPVPPATLNFHTCRNTDSVKQLLYILCW